MRRSILILISLCLFGVAGCDDKSGEKAKEKEQKNEEQPKAANIKVPLLVNVLKGVTRAPDDTDPNHTNQPTQDELKKRIAEAVKGANKILPGAGVELTFDPEKDIQVTDNPDESGKPEMDAKGDLDKIQKKADEELQKKFGGPPVKGFKIYITLAINNLPPGENGLGVSDESPGFAILEAGELEARLLAHEIGHGLGCLKDTDRKGALMNPKGTKDDKDLIDEEKKKLKECAEKRKS